MKSFGELKDEFTKRGGIIFENIYDSQWFTQTSDIANPAFNNISEINVLSLSLFLRWKHFFHKNNNEINVDAILSDSRHNPPKIIMTTQLKSLLQRTHCFNNLGEALKLIKEHGSLVISADQKLEPGRHRYTCTSQSNVSGRYYWFSHQWLNLLDWSYQYDI